ncbi:MAG: hypothetical protein WCY11_10750 [Novosphingobium sp.]
MDMGIEHDRFWAEHVPDCADDGQPHPDWHGLLARFRATAELRAQCATAPAVLGTGSFDRASAGRLRDFADGLPDVNLAGLAIGKSGACRDGEADPASTVAGRG